MVEHARMVRENMPEWMFEDADCIVVPEKKEPYNFCMTLFSLPLLDLNQRPSD